MKKKKKYQTDNTNGCNTAMIVNTVVWFISVLMRSGWRPLLEPKFVFTKCWFTTRFTWQSCCFIFGTGSGFEGLATLSRVVCETINRVKIYKRKIIINYRKKNQTSKSEWQISFSCVCVSGCAGCGRDIKNGQALLALESQWHLGCFKCKACAKVLTGEYISK